MREGERERERDRETERQREVGVLSWCVYIDILCSVSLVCVNEVIP